MRGNLRIGDEWQAITLLARSQPNPLKAVAELVENAIDARATEIVIVRDRIDGIPCLCIVDNGDGLRLRDDGEPDFEYVATHICDSMKRALPAFERRGVQGEYGIGLLSFWTLGRELTMVARNRDGEPREMTMREGEPSFLVRSGSQPALVSSEGVELTVRELHPTTKRAVTGEKMRRYLSAELRDRLRERGVAVSIDDRIARRTFTVEPRGFDGERIERVKRIAVPGFGVARAELYLDLSRDDGAVWLARNGTRVLDDLSHVAGLDRRPWTDGVLSGVIDFPALQAAPGTRHGVIPDAACTALVQALEEVANEIGDLLSRRSEPSRTNRAVARDVRRALARAIDGLPGDAFPEFAGGREAADAAPLVDAAATLDAPDEPEAPGGPLATARIAPQRLWIAVDGSRRLRVDARDEAGRPAAGRLVTSWHVKRGPITIDDSDRRSAVVRGLDAGRATIQATVGDGDRAVTTVATITVGSRGQAKPPGLPSYELVEDPGRGWRSRFVAERNAIQINSAHADFAWSGADAARRERYLSMLYCKEIVRRTAPGASAEEALDRFVQLASRLAP